MIPTLYAAAAGALTVSGAAELLGSRSHKWLLGLAQLLLSWVFLRAALIEYHHEKARS